MSDRQLSDITSSGVKVHPILAQNYTGSLTLTSSRCAQLLFIGEEAGVRAVNDRSVDLNPLLL